MKPTALTPDATSFADAMSASASLALLAERMRASNARFAAIRHRLPGALASQVRAGPLDDAGWSILAANPAVAAKLRHLVPQIQSDLRDAGLPVPLVRVKVAV